MVTAGPVLRQLREALGLGLKPLARKVGVTHSHLSRVERGLVQPSEELLERLSRVLGARPESIKLRAGIIPTDITQIFAQHPREAALVVRESFTPYKARRKNAGSPRKQGGPRGKARVGHPRDVLGRAGLRPAARTDLGALYRMDCMDFLRALPSDSVDLVFADPPFNLGKDYGKGISDKRKDDDYLVWCREWLLESARVLAPGGALFVFNLPKWLIHFGTVLECHGMQFRHWIACRMPKSLPIPGRLSPAHYGLLYYTKGKPRVFNKVYVPIPSCRHCGGDIRDYGGHRKFLNVKGLNLMDVWDAPDDVWATLDPAAAARPGLWRDADEIWDDIPPVRHSQYKLRGANELAPIMLERIVAFATNKGDLVVDPFAGTGTTAYAAERLGRRWLASDVGDASPATRRIKDLLSGKVAHWESARGNGRSRKQRHSNLQLSLAEDIGA
jgi:site-specific DNA-methyltransferase (adenine-specific)